MDRDKALAFLARHRIARLATASADGGPHLVPICFVVDGTRLYTPLDQKPKRVSAGELRRVRNILANPKVAVLVDDYSEDWRQLVWVMVRGAATLLGDGQERDKAIRLLQRKYPQYRQVALEGIISIRLDDVSGWQWAHD